MSELSTRDARSAIDVALKKAEEVGVPVTVAILDHSRDLLGFLRMDKALLGTIEVAQGKAYTARTVEMKTSDLGKLCQPGGPLYGFETSHRQPLIVFGGGVPVRRGGRVVGAVGISGGTVEQDEVIAEEVVAFLEAY